MSLDNPVLIPVPFHGDTITCIETPAGEFVAIRPICDRLSLNFSGQLQRLKADPDLWGVCVIHTPSAGGTQETNCIPRSRVAAWLFKIEISRVKPEAREALRLYQREAADVLDRHFRLRSAETSARIAELERMLWHSHQQLRIDNPKWGRAFMMQERGDSDYLIAQRNNWNMDRARSEIEAMRRCGMNPRWREDMGTLIDQNADLRWKLDRASRAKASGSQPSLFGEG